MSCSIGMFQLSSIALVFTLFAGTSVAQQTTAPTTYDTIIRSPVDPNITISYKQPDRQTCATTIDTQKQYTGYISFPSASLAPHQQDGYAHTFFWFFESRQNPESAPLTIWLQGGPGTSSMVGLFQELGPCEIIQVPDSGYKTQPRPWGWDRTSNLLFIDQPTQTGFSYDKRVHASVDLDNEFPYSLQNRILPQDVPTDTPTWRVMNGTFASSEIDDTQNSTAIAAEATWHFLQGFLSVFPQYNPGIRPNSATVNQTGVHLFTESYGGVYSSQFVSFFEMQNDRRNSGSIPASALDIRVESLGIMNGMVDLLTQTIAVANFTKHNSYGIEAIDSHAHQQTISNIENSDYGCRMLIKQCHDEINDLQASNRQDDMDKACRKAVRACDYATRSMIDQSGKSPYDIRFRREAGPGAAYQEYLNYDNVMKSIGAQINFTQSSTAVNEAFIRTGDSARGTQLVELAGLLNRGVRVALIYGDADIICNWHGGENASIELSRSIPGYSNAFPASGYADIVVNQSYVGGQVRQYGNLSFSRIYDAGHLVPYDQPETAFAVFDRIIQGDDIATGKRVDLSTFSTQGSSESLHLNQVPEERATHCWIRDVEHTCTNDEKETIHQGRRSVENGIWKNGLEADNSVPRSDSRPRTVMTRTKTSSPHQTGIYTPRPKPMRTPNAAVSRKLQFRLYVPPFSGNLHADRGGSTGMTAAISVLVAVMILLCTVLPLVLLFLWYRNRHPRNFPSDTEKTPEAGLEGTQPGAEDPAKPTEDAVAPTAPDSAQPPSRAATVPPAAPAASEETAASPTTSPPDTASDEAASRKPSVANRTQSNPESKTDDAEKAAVATPPSRAPTAPPAAQQAEK